MMKYKVLRQKNHAMNVETVAEGLPWQDAHDKVTEINNGWNYRAWMNEDKTQKC